MFGKKPCRRVDLPSRSGGRNSASESGIGERNSAGQYGLKDEPEKGCPRAKSAGRHELAEIPDFFGTMPERLASVSVEPTNGSTNGRSRKVSSVHGDWFRTSWRDGDGGSVFSGFADCSVATE